MWLSVNSPFPDSSEGSSCLRGVFFVDSIIVEPLVIIFCDRVVRDGSHRKSRTELTG